MAGINYSGLPTAKTPKRRRRKHCHGPILKMRTCAVLWTRGLVKPHQAPPKSCSSWKFASGQVHRKWSPVVLLLPFYQACITADLCELLQVDIPACISPVSPSPSSFPYNSLHPDRAATAHKEVYKHMQLIILLDDLFII